MDENCGWCNDCGKCLEGGETTPTKVVCKSWDFQTCTGSAGYDTTVATTKAAELALRSRLEKEWRLERDNFIEASTRHSRLQEAAKMTASIAAAVTKESNNAAARIPMLKDEAEGHVFNCSDGGRVLAKREAAAAKAKADHDKAAADLAKLIQAIDATSGATEKAALQQKKVLVSSLATAAAATLGNATQALEAAKAAKTEACAAAAGAGASIKQAGVDSEAKKLGAVEMSALNALRDAALKSAAQEMSRARQHMQQLTARGNAMVEASRREAALAGKKSLCPARPAVDVPPLEAAVAK